MISKILNIFAFFLILVAVIFIIIALISASEHQISYTRVIKSPNPIVWRTLLNIDKIPQWNSDLIKVELEKGTFLEVGTIMKCYLDAKDDNLYYREEVTQVIDEKKLSLQMIMDNQSNHLSEHTLDFQLKPLLDGSTEITLLLSYKINSIITKIYNVLYLNRALEHKIITRLNSLKKIIENV
jgi:uncharacterized protein YndB with AHSA1/START domain